MIHRIQLLTALFLKNLNSSGAVSEQEAAGWTGTSTENSYLENIL